MRTLDVVRLAEHSIRSFFARRMTTYAAALAYRTLFGLFPFVLLTFVLLGLVDLDDPVRRMIEQADPELPQGTSGMLVSVVSERRAKRPAMACFPSGSRFPCTRCTPWPERWSSP